MRTHEEFMTNLEKVIKCSTSLIKMCESEREVLKHNIVQLCWWLFGDYEEIEDGDLYSPLYIESTKRKLIRDGIRSEKIQTIIGFK